MVGARSFLVEVSLGVIEAKENSEIVYTWSPGNGDCTPGESFSLGGLMTRGWVSSALDWAASCPPPSERVSWVRSGMISISLSMAPLCGRSQAAVCSGLMVWAGLVGMTSSSS